LRRRFVEVENGVGLIFADETLDAILLKLPGLDLELDATNLTDNRYQISKESEEIPIQFAASRTLGGSLKFHF
jgi:hypothetical protein